MNGQSHNYIGRLNANGTLDATFNAQAGYHVDSLALQTDGKVLVAGYFYTLNGENLKYAARLNTDGTLDTSFNPAIDYYAYSLALQADGRILIGGSFDWLAGQSRSRLGRLINTAPATQVLTYDGSSLIWARGGSSPEFWHVAFECSTNGGSVWTNLGAGTRIQNGWQLTGVSTPPNAFFRARGYTVGGEYSGSGWFVETVLPPALRISDPFYTTTGSVGFRAWGPPSEAMVIEISPDLMTWAPLQTNILGAGPFSFIDPQPVVTARFYRLRSAR